MMKFLLGIFLVISLSVPVCAEELIAPEVPNQVSRIMPQETESFGKGLWELFQNSITLLQPELEEAMHVSSCVIGTALLVSVLSLITERIHIILSIAGTVATAGILFQNTNSMLAYATDAVREICEYGKLLCPVMTMALAAQGGFHTSAVLYAGTTVFITILSLFISKVLLPMLYIFLALSLSYSAMGNEIMKRFSDSVKTAMSWMLKTLLIIFTTYMSITGVVSGTTDAAAVKAAKVTISSVVPVVGGILSDASESVLISMGIMKNAAGIYGILAVLAMFMGPFVKVGTQYLLLRISAGICGMFGNKYISSLIADVSTVMGLLLAMVASGCVLVLVSTVCFMKGIG